MYKNRVNDIGYDNIFIYIHTNFTKEGEPQTKMKLKKNQTNAEMKLHFKKSKNSFLEEKNYFKQETGITLVALIITIVLNCSCLAMERM